MLQVSTDAIINTSVLRWSPLETLVLSRTKRLSGNLEFHPVLSEKAIGVPPPCLEVVLGLRRLCVYGLSDPETAGSFP
jgi:hypothetical protein